MLHEQLCVSVLTLHCKELGKFNLLVSKAFALVNQLFGREAILWKLTRSG